MKIAIVSAVYYPMINGAAVFTHNLAVGLAKQGHEVALICPSFTGKKHLEKKGNLTEYYLNSVRMPLYPDQINDVPQKKRFLGKEMPKVFYRRGFWISPAPYAEVRKILKKFRPDVIHSQTADPIGVAASMYAREKELPFVTTGHNYPDQLTGQLKGIKFMKKPIDAALAAYMANYRDHSDYMTMPTEIAIEDLVLKRRKKIKIPFEALSNGVDLSEFKPGRANLRTYNRYKLPTDRPIVLYIGRVDPAKSISTVIEAFAQVLESVPEAELVIVGDGIELEHLKKLAEYLQINQSVKFLGKVLPPELYDLYKAGDVFVTASETETQGIVLIEAAATGLPLVAVDKGAVREVCRDQENGFLCKAGGDIDGIAKSVIKILTDRDLKEKFSKKSLEIAKAHDFNHTLKRFEEIYMEAIEKKAEEEAED